ncbi:glutathione S-transferase [Candidatus Nitrosoglobus terrae]|uniref:Glutathione S-transferase n=1 Tax=Candidatus Nitrosoglobus terrae TaxID=1630141 RepID=A0A1Q2SPQ6_9GAMM|nr:glutathione S-transferase N-terminal domain-containing protein [Candidatus Nitrosoglobus terrae]BAW81118.1 glutathione S-transferase [Candidatus Nitrosoglobus terrae]
MTISNKRTTTTLFSDPLCPVCHRTRIVIAEKNIPIDIINVDPNNPPEELILLNPYNSVPTLIDRDLTLYESKVIMEYFDERFPHPPLMPIDPISRARIRLTLHRVDLEWYRLLGSHPYFNISLKARKALAEDLTILSPVFERAHFFMSEEFSLLDAALGALLWRLPVLEIKLPSQAKFIESYANRIFSRDSFQRSLSDAEREMRSEVVGIT